MSEFIRLLYFSTLLNVSTVTVISPVQFLAAENDENFWQLPCKVRINVDLRERMRLSHPEVRHHQTSDCKSTVAVLLHSHMFLNSLNKPSTMTFIPPRLLLPSEAEPRKGFRDSASGHAITLLRRTQYGGGG